MRGEIEPIHLKQTRRPERVAVFGGAGDMGRITVDLFQQLGHDVIISDPRHPESVPAHEAIQRSNIIFFSVLRGKRQALLIGKTYERR